MTEVQGTQSFVAASALTAGSTALKSIEGIAAVTIQPGAEAYAILETKAYRYIEDSLTPPSGTTVILPSSLDVSEPGRWVEVTGGGGGGENLAQTLALGNDNGGLNIFMTGNARIESPNANEAFEILVAGPLQLTSNGGTNNQIGLLVAASPSGVAGGQLSLSSGDGADTAGGNLVLDAGNGPVGGDVQITAGVGQTQGGNLLMGAANGNGGVGGNAQLDAGAGVTGGNVAVSAGIGTGGAGTGGSISLVAGSGAAEGGNIELVTGDGAAEGQLILNAGDPLIWPPSDGAADEVLRTDGAGNLSFGQLSTDNILNASTIPGTTLTDVLNTLASLLPP